MSATTVAAPPSQKPFQKPSGTVLKDLAEDAVAKLLDYNRVPFVEDYLASERIPRGTANKVLAAVLPGALLGHNPQLRPSLEALIDRLDELQETGRQVAFLFTLPRQDRDQLLARLRDPAFLEERLRIWICGPADRFNRHLRVWSTPKPELSAAWHDGEKERLVLKWVKTRKWHKQEGDERHPKLVEKTERVAQIVRFDLRTGDSEILLPPLQTYPEQTLQEELAACKTLTESLLGFAPFVPVSLEPAVRRAIEDGEVDLTSWSVLRASAEEEGELHWNGRPQRHHGPPAEAASYTGLRAVYEERFQRRREEAHIPVALDAPRGSVEIRKPCLPEEHAAILARIHLWLLRISDPDLQKAALSLREVAHVISRVDEALQDDRMAVDGGELMLEGVSFAAVEAAFLEIRRQNPKRFEMVYRVTDPRTGRVRDLATRPPDLPETAVRPEIREIPRGWLFRLTRLLGVRVVRRMVRDLWNLLFSAAYAAVIIAASRPFLAGLADTVPGQTLRAFVLTLTLVIVVAFWLKMVGADAAGEAVRLVLRVLGRVADALGVAFDFAGTLLQTAFGKLKDLVRHTRGRRPHAARH